MSSYIGTSNAEKIFPENTVDVIAVQTGKTQYRLSQDVPGGYEANVLAIKNGVVLKPESDYLIDYSVPDQKNILITFLIPLNVTDLLYVIHKGIATYNLVPSQGSVTDASLSENLRTFIFDKFSGDNVEDEFVLSKQEFYPRSLLVYVAGAIQRPYIDVADEPDKWDFKLEQVDELTSKIVFRVAPPIGDANVCVLHLAFSTVLRRSDYLTAINLAPNIIENFHLDDNAVSGAKLLLLNDESVNSLDSLGTTEIGLIKLNPDDNVDIFSKLLVTPTAIEPIGTINIGTLVNKFNEAHIATIAADLIETENLNVNDQLVAKGTSTFGELGNPVDFTIHGDNVNISANNFNLNGLSIESIPLGVVQMYYGTILPNDPDSKYLFCDGSAIPGDLKYDDFKAWLLTQGLPNTHTPNLTNRFPYGGPSPGTLVGSETHFHNIDDHDHDLTAGNAPIVDSGHTHEIHGNVTIPNHSHTMNNHTHTVNSHDHEYDYRHIHSVNFLSGDKSPAHFHSIEYRILKVALGGATDRYLLVSQGGQGLYSSNLETTAHFHTVVGNTQLFGSPGTAPNWGANNVGNAPGNPAKNVTGTRSPGTSVPSNNNTSNAGSGTFALDAGAATYSDSANVSISGKTESKAGLMSQSASHLPPGLTLNFIIRAIP